MPSFVTLLAMAAIGVWMQWLVFRFSTQNGAIAKWRGVLLVIAAMWFAIPWARIYYLDSVIPPVDGLEHEEVARYLARLMHQGDWGEALQTLGLGNRSYRFALGVFYALTGVEEIVTYALQGMLAFWATLSMLDVLSRHTGCRTISPWAITLMCCAPSTLFWTPWNIKEGVMLWGIAMTMRLSLRTLPSRGRKELVLPLLGVFMAGVLRPHIIVAVISGMCVAVALIQRRFGLLAMMASLVVGAGFAFATLASDLVEKMASDGVGQTLNSQYSARAQMGGSAISHGQRGPTPVWSGLLLLCLRPYPTEVSDPVSAAAGLEIWLITATGAIGWLRSPAPRRMLKSPCVISSIVTLLLLAFFFTYIYNMGLMVRQRVMAYPFLLTITLAPQFFHAGVLANVRAGRRRRSAYAPPQPKLLTPNAG